MRALIVGWFSYENRGATVGDVAAARVVKDWLQEKSIQADICENDWHNYSPENYQIIFFVCGPIAKSWIGDLIAYFNKPTILVNNTLMDDTGNCLVVARDSTTISNVDISMAAPVVTSPLVGLILVDTQTEYGDRNNQAFVGEVVQKFIINKCLDVVRINTELAGNIYSPSVVEQLISRMSVVITNRLHGLVYSVKYRVPVVLIDGVTGGDKVSRQAKAIGWPVVGVSDLTEDALQSMFDFCLTAEAKKKIETCHIGSLLKVQEVKSEFFSALDSALQL